MRVVLLAVALLTFTSALSGAEAAWDFERQMPGELPNGWIRMWGEQGDDQLLVSNVKAVGRNSMLLDRGSNIAQWGAGAKLPEFNSGWLRVAFSFLVDGSADGARVRFGLEIRNQFPPPQYYDMALGVSFYRGQVFIQPRRLEQFSGNIVSLGDYRRDEWYRVTLWWPAAAGDETKGVAWARLERLAKGGAEPVGEPLRVDCVPARKGRMAAVMQLNSYPGEAHNNFKVYLDDIEARQVDELPEFPSLEPNVVD